MIRALLLAVAVTAVGLLGAAAFNPDDGFVLRSEPLWRVFGIGAYAGFAAAYVIPVLAVARLILFAGRRAGRRRRRSA